MSSETAMIDHHRRPSTSVALAVLEERMTRLANDFDRLLKMQEQRDRADMERSRVEGTITSQLAGIQASLDDIKKEQARRREAQEDIDARLKVLEGKRQSDDRRRREAETGPHTQLTIIESQQRVEESRKRTKLWTALTGLAAAAGGALATWLATK